MSQTVLALDTATPFLTLALRWARGERLLSTEVGRAHAELLADAVAVLYAEANLPLRADVVVIGTGPGSYTGVRVGASYALGLARVWNAPVLGVPTLEALTHQAPDGPLATSLDARKGNVYGAVYQVKSGVVQAVLSAPAKHTEAEFADLAQSFGAKRHHDTAPDGLALLQAGLDHGQSDWKLHYL